MKRIVLSGYYGFNNLGDEAVLESILNNIREALGDIQITVLSADPRTTEALYGVTSVGRTSPLGILKALWRCDVLVSGGGSLLQDVTGRLSIFYYLALIALGKLLGKRVMIYSQGIGPIHKPFNRYLTRHVLSRVDAITVREPNSRADLARIGIDADRITITADPVISLAPDANPVLPDWVRQSAAFIPGGPVVGLAFRGKDLSFGADTKLLTVIKALRREYSANVLLIPYYGVQDNQMLDALEAEAAELVIPVRRPLRVNEMLDLTACLDVLVGTRLHSLIISAICGTPMIAVSYDPKIEYFMETIHRSVFEDVRSFDADKLLAEIGKTLNAGPLPMDIVKDRVAGLREKLHQNEAILKKLLN